MKHRCIICGYVYDPEQGDERSKTEAGTSFEELPPRWRCPKCRAGKFLFKPLE